MKRLWSALRNFLLFFAIVGFVVTCSFLLFGASVSLSEEDVRAFAPIVFFNVLLLSALFAALDAVRRKLTVDRPVREIRKALRRLQEGDFSARITLPSSSKKEFKEIAASINLLAEELAGVETLRTDFIANVSHELKTPLAVIRNYNTMLSAPTLSDEQRQEYAATINATSRRLADLITNILKLNKLENQQIYPSVAEYDLGEQLCECLLSFEAFWERKHLVIETDIAENVRIRSDAELLSLVWNNLISNAIKFTEEGGTVTVTLTATAHHATVTITDTGCGISPEIGPHIFEKFYQGDTSHAMQGNGLGLALVKRVVDIVHGEITVESAIGKGSTFTVKLRRLPDA